MKITEDSYSRCKNALQQPVTQQREINYGAPIPSPQWGHGYWQGEACRSAETYFIGRMALISALSLRRLQTETKTRTFPQTMFDIRIPADLVHGNSRILRILSLWRVPDPKLLMSEVANNELVSGSHKIVLCKELEVACTSAAGGCW
jgi:hypothetical protein